MGAISLELPVALVDAEAAPVDSATRVFEGAGVTVIVDQGPFADRLEGDRGRPQYREETREIGDTTGRVVSFRSADDATRTLAARLVGPPGVTVVVRADASVPAHVPRDIVNSLRVHPGRPEGRSGHAEAGA